MAQRLMRWWVASFSLSLGWVHPLALTSSPPPPPTPEGTTDTFLNGDASRLRRETLLQRWLGNPRTEVSSPSPLAPLSRKGPPSSASLPVPSSIPACPANVEPLMTELLKDLPSYANRVSQKARRLNRTADFSSYVLVAGRPEFAPLTLGPGEYTSPVTSVAPPQQVFFTTLERQYTLGKAIELQQYHWLFLTQTTSGWRLAMMFSQIGPYPAGRPPTPPRDSSNGVIAQAIRTWLGDCRSGAVRTNRSP